MNPAVRRFPNGDTAGLARRRRGGGPSLMGTPYKALDRFSVWLMWITAIVGFVVLAIVDGNAAIPWVFAVTPGPIGLACLLAKMVDCDGVTRVIAFTYAVTVTLALSACVAYAS